ncbi:MAG: isocitrate lyase/PEP mutase family protein [Dehalococcoidia bacterium]|uniref:Oxaloacetate decarboxylase n=1 Tax=marine metagenome TaxID=408172 RepID=A0A381TPY6_9ZZZZ|nr:oxaloacetate decarboxylase [Chloroflexota bacterium]MCH2313141.1 isocitrate lyase/PEP mutase family protein [SAR202 cluster bacterium]MCS5647967.1 isocitrate lyase/PEP mutase family protein [Dehalococcoidia bacterium]HBF00880.1 oxaloacetate decarboxylase [Dehalococcoidia bacterium]HBR65281.1 oxaloacetate decarboxylase [Dehalococcoidia bacterium]
MIDSQKRNQFRQILTGNQCVHPGSVFDAISSRIAEDLGYQAGMFAGSIASAVVLGDPDHILITLTEFAEQARRICRASDLPIMVDADHGYGNALNVKRTVEELENAGVAALTIEDTVLPRQFGKSKPELIPIPEGIGKMKAALSGRKDQSLVIAGRTSAFQVTGTEDAIERAKAYESIGVDAIFFAGLTTRPQLEAVKNSIEIPIMLGSTPKDINDNQYLSSMGVKIALQGHLPFMAAVKATRDTMKALVEGNQPSEVSTAALDSELIDTVTKDQQFKDWFKEFLS